jgi:copper chaperone
MGAELNQGRDVVSKFARKPLDVATVASPIYARAQTKGRAEMLRYSVPDMTCGHCAQAIEKAVKSVDPQAEVAVDLTTKEVTVRSEADEARVAETIRGAGYEPRFIAAQ